jgi:hypothetical protein
MASYGLFVPRLIRLVSIDVNVASGCSSGEDKSERLRSEGDGVDRGTEVFIEPDICPNTRGLFLPHSDLAIVATGS